MSDYDLVIRNGTVVTASDTVCCDVGIREGRIVALAEELGSGQEEIDASDLQVLPGGVDSHCHLDQPVGGGARMADNFESGTRSAAAGGNTTLIPFAAQMKGHGLRAAVDDYHRRAGNMAYIDYAFHMIVTEPCRKVLRDELPALISEGYTSFKIYMTYDDLRLDDRQILETLAVARREGAMVMVHAENHDCIGYLTDLLEAAGSTAPRYHAESRPPLVEREATNRALCLAELVDVPVLIVHVSGGDSIEQIRWAQGRGHRVYAETCPQYLYLTAEDLGIDGFDGAKCVCSPPPRDARSQEEVWTGLQNGVFQVFSSDHAPFCFEDSQGKKLHGESTSFPYIPNGVPGLETRLPLLYSGGVQTGRIDINRFVELTSTNAAKIYGLYPRKGTIAVGSDADIALWDPNCTTIIRNDQLHHAVDYTPYEGMSVQGWPVMTVLRGKVVSRHGSVVGRAGGGQFLPCDRPQWAQPRVGVVNDRDQREENPEEEV